MSGSALRVATGADAVVATLRSLGARVAFGIPGQHALPIWEALRTHELRYVPARTELCAAFAADGYARVCGEPAPLLLSTGPGALNALTGLMEAAASYVPVLAIATQIERDLLGRRRGALHELPDQLASFAPIVKWARRATSVESIAPLLRQAWLIASTAPSGPVFVEIPHDLLALPLAETLTESAPRPLPSRALPPSGALRQAANALAAASRPAIWAGGGVQRSTAFTELQALAEQLGAPVATTYMGKGAIPEDHPLAVGSACQDSDIVDLVGAADVLLCVGTELGAEVTSQFSLKIPGQLIHIDADPLRPGTTYPALALVGDARATLTELAAEIQRLKPSAIPSWPATTWWRARSTDAHVNPLAQQLLSAIRTALPRDAIHAWDMTILGYWASSRFTTLAPRTFLHAFGSATLGYAWPAALGAKIAEPSREVLAVVGDGGVLYALAELGVAHQEGIAAKLLIVDDQSYGILGSYQDEAFGVRHGVALSAVDFVAIAEAFGVPARRTSVDELEGTLNWALDTGGPAAAVLSVNLQPPAGA